MRNIKGSGGINSIMNVSEITNIIDMSSLHSLSYRLTVQQSYYSNTLAMMLVPVLKSTICFSILPF